jgi:nucleoside-diphosphate-sugar epimerase
MSARVLLTGAIGYIGGRLLRSLEEGGLLGRAFDVLQGAFRAKGMR